MQEFQVKTFVFEDAETGERRDVRIGAVTSVPRLAFTAHWGELHKAFDGLNIPVLKMTGYSWGASLQRGVQMLVDAGCDYVITIDFDSIFCQQDLIALLTLAARYREADAIFPWQVKRGGVDKLLLGLRDAEGSPLHVAPTHIFNTEMTRCNSGHFGLTLLKVKALNATPKPWWWEQPNKDGDWEDGKEDADMYFWRKFCEAGRIPYLATDVRIGHIDEHILWPNDVFAVTRQSVQDYLSNGRPNLNIAAPPILIPPGPVRLNLGSGAIPLEGWVNMDAKDGHWAFPLNVPDATADEIRASHILEHFPHRAVGAVVKEWARALKPGGKLKVAVPDFDWIVKEYSNGHRHDRMLEMYLFGGQVDANDYHKAFFNQDKLKAILEEAGLIDVKWWEADAPDCSSYQVSLNLEGRKPLNDAPHEFPEGAKGVVHVGANSGQERAVYAQLDLPVVWIEAGADAFRQLVNNIANYPNQRALRYLIADADDAEHVFHVSNDEGQASSIYEFGDHKTIWPSIDYVSHGNYLSTTLKTALQRHAIDPTDYALILDVQGAELLVLKGAGDLLDKFKFIRCEAADFELYKGGCQLKDLDEFFTARGWKRSRTWVYAHDGTSDNNGIYEAVYEKGETLCQ